MFISVCHKYKLPFHIFSFHMLYIGMFLMLMYFIFCFFGIGEGDFFNIFIVSRQRWDSVECKWTWSVSLSQTHLTILLLKFRRNWTEETLRKISKMSWPAQIPKSAVKGQSSQTFLIKFFLDQIIWTDIHNNFIALHSCWMSNLCWFLFMWRKCWWKLVWVHTFKWVIIFHRVHCTWQYCNLGSLNDRLCCFHLCWLWQVSLCLQQMYCEVVINNPLSSCTEQIREQYRV